MPGTPSIRAASLAARPDTAATTVSGIPTSSATTRRVASGTAACSGRLAIGASVPSMSSNATNGLPDSRRAIAGVSGSGKTVMSSPGGRTRTFLGGHDAGGSCKNGVEPVEDGGVVQTTAHAVHATSPFVGRHIDGSPDGFHEAVDVEGIDEQRAVDLFGGAREATEDQDAALVELARDKLLGHEIHSVLQRRHDAQIAGAVDGSE